MAKSQNSSIVAPKEFIDDPQTHFAQLRLKESYKVEQNGKFVQASRMITLDVTKYLSYAPAMKNIGPEEIMRFPDGWTKIFSEEPVKAPVEKTPNEEASEVVVTPIDEDLPILPVEDDKTGDDDEEQWNFDNKSGEVNTVVTWSSILPDMKGT